VPNRKLWKTTVVIWTDEDPQGVELDTLVSEAIHGDAYCSKQETKYVTDVTQDKDWDNNEFFDDYCEEE